LLTLLLIFVALSARASMNQDWQQAGNTYERGDFAEAIRLYEKMADSSPGGWIYYNLGNAYFKAGQLGEAVLAYRRAQLFLPRSKEVRLNLEQALRSAGVEELGPKGVGALFRMILHFVTLEEHLIIFSLAFLPGVLFGMIWSLTQALWARTLSLTLIGCAIMVLIALGCRHLLDSQYREAVILSEETYGHVMPDEHNEKVFRVTAGNLVYLMGRRRGGWVEVSLHHGERAWIRSADLAPVVLEQSS